MFASNTYRLHAINRMAEDQTAIVYRSGTHVDLAYGPHIPDISLIKAFRATQVRRSLSPFRELRL